MFILEGLLLGFASVLLIGPVVFVLINASVNQGARSGVAVALGIVLGDALYTIICYKSMDFFLQNELFKTYVAYVGFIILFLLGISYLFKKTNRQVIKTGFKKKDMLKNFISGFSINFFNPFVLSIWLLVVNYANVNHSENTIPFLISALLGIFLIDLLKVFLSKKLQKFLQKKKLELFYKVSGIIMIFFSLRILYFILFA